MSPRKQRERNEALYAIAAALGCFIVATLLVAGALL
jgi:hypothetical protein